MVVRVEEFPTTVVNIIITIIVTIFINTVIILLLIIIINNNIASYLRAQLFLGLLLLFSLFIKSFIQDKSADDGHQATRYG